jgi:hypothetical protein
MSEMGKQAVAGFLGGAISSGNALVAVLSETPWAEVTQGQWVVMVAGGAVSTFVAWRTLLTESP